MSAASDLIKRLNRYGELHVTLDSGDEFHLHKHDVHEGEHNHIVIESRRGKWRFDAEKVESVKVPESHKE